MQQNKYQKHYHSIYHFIFVYMMLSIGTSVYAEQIDQGNITFERGNSSALVSGAVVRGDRDVYALNAGAGQWMEVKITALENNAVFSLLLAQDGVPSQELEGATEQDEAKYWYGQLPDPATSANGKRNAVDIIIGGTRGNAAYKFTVTIKDQSWKSSKASFDCKKATTQAEKLICDNSELREADIKMSAAYQKLRKALASEEQKILKADQRSWLKERDKEFKTCESPYCHVFYLSRIEQLEPMSKAGFNCKKAGTAVEKKICNSRLLQHADGRMSAAYKDLIKLDDGAYYDPKEQRAWLKMRNQALAKSSCDTACAFKVYNEHTNELARRLLHIVL